MITPFSSTRKKKNIWSFFPHYSRSSVAAPMFHFGAKVYTYYTQWHTLRKYTKWTVSGSAFFCESCYKGIVVFKSTFRTCLFQSHQEKFPHSNYLATIIFQPLQLTEEEKDKIDALLINLSSHIFKEDMNKEVFTIFRDQSMKQIEKIQKGYPLQNFGSSIGICWQ